jgi:hypothetical protein
VKRRLRRLNRVVATSLRGVVHIMRIGGHATFASVSSLDHRNLRSRSGMHLCMQDDQNGQKTIMLTSSEENRLTCFILLQNIFFCNKQPSLTADVNTIMNLPWYPRKIVHFSLVLLDLRFLCLGQISCFVRSRGQCYDFCGHC